MCKALYISPTGIPVHSISTCMEHSATLQLLRDDYSITYLPLSVTRFSCIHISEYIRGVN